MLISEFRGVVKMAPPGGHDVNPTPVLTLTNIHLQAERGLVGILVDPDFNSNHFFYVFYTASNPARDRVSRFILDGGAANPALETVIWQSTSDSNEDHHGGDMAFGLDGKLYITTGDNTNPPNAQQLSNDHGKILRINSDGTIPTDNPFYDGAGPNADAIWALGLRNPYRFSIDPVTGRMYIGDVGNNLHEARVSVRATPKVSRYRTYGPSAMAPLQQMPIRVTSTPSPASMRLDFLYRTEQHQPSAQ
jgi:glucose/arabinose dehydrogenase